MRIGIIGAGHAGVAAALATVHDNVGSAVTLFSNETVLPYFRPRMPGVAFGQVEKDLALMHPLDWYYDKNINLRLNESIRQISLDADVIDAISVLGNKYSFDKVIITTGALPIIPPFARHCNKNKVIPLWNIEHADTISNRLAGIGKIIIIGGGVIGIEAALRAVDVGLKVTIIERNCCLMERNLSSNASSLLARILEKRGIEIYASTSVISIDDSSSPLS